MYASPTSRGARGLTRDGRPSSAATSDDVLAPARQEQILDVVERLSSFNPTRVAIESRWGDTVSTGRYQAYLAGEVELSRQEEEQIGFRLAAAMGHETVYPVDVKIDLPSDRLESVLEARPELGRYMAGLEEYGEWAMASMAKWLSEGTVGEMLYRMNTPEAIEWADRGYLEFFLPLVAGDDYGGADGLHEHRAAGKRYCDYNREQQGQIAQDYSALLAAGEETSAYEPFIKELREGLV